MDHSAGLAIIYQKKLLLAHSTGGAWYNTFSIPKGLVEDSESFIKTALRETFEEVGFELGEGWIDKKEYIIEYRNRHFVYKKLHWFKVDISDLPFNEIKHLFPSFPRDQLQLGEIDYAAFMDKENALERIFWRQKSILDIL